MVKLVLAYDGTDFSGWQRQDGERSVQGVVEEALARMHGADCPVVGSGRTDAGVHARGQVASFACPIPGMPIPRYRQALNSLLPPDVRVMGASQAPEGFHARFDARFRTYRYFIVPGDRALPSQRRYAWCLRHWPNPSRLDAMASCLRGELDCSSFSCPRDQSRSRHRFLKRASFFSQQGQLVFEICANAFLWRMVRSLVGSLIDYERRGLPEDYLSRVILERDRSLAGPTAPAQGLFLWSVDYD